MLFSFTHLLTIDDGQKSVDGEPAEPREQTPYSATFIANEEKHKSEWCTDIAQCLQNLRYTELLTGTFRNASSVIAPESVK